MLELRVHAHCLASGSMDWNPKQRLVPTIRIKRMTYRLQGENKNLCNPHECLISYDSTLYLGESRGNHGLL